MPRSGSSGGDAFSDSVTDADTTYLIGSDDDWDQWYRDHPDQLNPADGQTAANLEATNPKRDATATAEAADDDELGLW